MNFSKWGMILFTLLSVGFLTPSIHYWVNNSCDVNTYCHYNVDKIIANSTTYHVDVQIKSNECGEYTFHYKCQSQLCYNHTLELFSIGNEVEMWNELHYNDPVNCRSPNWVPALFVMGVMSFALLVISWCHVCCAKSTSETQPLVVIQS